MKNLKRSLLAVTACLTLYLALIPAAFAGETSGGPGAAPTPTPAPIVYPEPTEEALTEDTPLLVTLIQLALMLL